MAEMDENRGGGDGGGDRVLVVPGGETTTRDDGLGASWSGGAMTTSASAVWRVDGTRRT